MDKDTKHIMDQVTGTEGYLECTKDKEKAPGKSKVIQLDVGERKRPLQQQWKLQSTDK